MVPSTLNINPIANLPKEIFNSKIDLAEKLIKLSVETNLESKKTERLLDIYC
ncbi:hypothetical protein P3G55_10145 [Leptospira sp. 96542]|nr:hypothetical protein [Leptospira sp. 96542]